MDASYGKFGHGIYIHHSTGPDRVTKDWDSIYVTHVIDNGWDAIGYHFGIERIGSAYQILTGRGLEWEGAHAYGFNKSIGICLIGDYDKDVPPKDMLKLLSRLVTGLMFIYDMRPEDLHYHSEVSSKTCPGKLFPKEQFRQLIVNNYAKGKSWSVSDFLRNMFQ